MTAKTEVLVIGAGPYGLSTAACLKRAGLDYRMVGKPMDFWISHMPAGMWLRSSTEWHIDPLGVHTMEAYCREQQLDPEQIEVVTLPLFLGYAQWFQRQKRLKLDPRLLRRLDRDGAGFLATFEEGDTLNADRVVIAAGFDHFKHIPQALAELLPEGRYAHTRDLVDFATLEGKRCLIVGGRQSALEWAALLHEHGAASVHLTHCHDTPHLERSDWSWVPQLAAKTVDDPGWFRRLPGADREEIAQRFWAEGRLKLEPWLAPRLDHDSIHFWPNTQVIGIQLSSPRRS